MEDYLEKATTLVEAMPYIKEFAGAVVVIKYGGAAMINETIKASVMEGHRSDEACGNEAGNRPWRWAGDQPNVGQYWQEIGVPRWSACNR